MAKDSPYFKFYVSDWMVGDIVFESFSAQGLFINICAIYWHREGKLTVADVNKRYNSPKELDDLLKGVLKTDDKGNIKISFLDEQLLERGFKSIKNSENGRKGGLAKAKNSNDTTNDTTNDSNPTGKPKNPTKKEPFVAPTVEEVKAYFKENGFNEDLGVRAFNIYDLGEWEDTMGNKIKNWKQKMHSVWFADKNKQHTVKPQTDRKPGWDYSDPLLPKNEKGQTVFITGKIVS